MKTCSRCIFDERVPDITFDANGICNYCHQFDDLEREYPTGEAGWKKLEEIGAQIKKSGRGKKYDCAIGISGGCDSSLLLHVAKVQLGLRPLAVHFDNGWNSDIAVENMRLMLDKLDVDAWTYTVDPDEFNDMARSMLRASVPEVDAISDVAVATTLYMAASKFNLKYVLDGHCFRTEGICPPGWFYFDGKYVDSIQRRFGTRRIETFPNLWLGRWMRWLLAGVKRPRLLWYYDFQKEETKRLLNSEYGWRWYGGHYLESTYTAFGHYLLREKFNVDLRCVELSARVRSGQMSREKAIEEFETPQAYPGDLVAEAKRRLNLSDEEYDAIIRLPRKSARDYVTYRPTFKRLRPFFWLMQKTQRVPKSFYMKYCR